MSEIIKKIYREVTEAVSDSMVQTNLDCEILGVVDFEDLVHPISYGVVAFEDGTHFPCGQFNLGQEHTNLPMGRFSVPVDGGDLVIEGSALLLNANPDEPATYGVIVNTEVRSVQEIEASLRVMRQLLVSAYEEPTSFAEKLDRTF